MLLRVTRKPGKARHEGLISWGNETFPCSIGRSGITTVKHEGDGATPAGRFKLLFGFYRYDRMGSLNTPLAIKPITPGMGWCDSPGDPAYNQLVRLPYKGSHEELMRDDRLYDVCIVLDYNVFPRARSRGSAIFFHLTRPDCGPTEGCVAIAPNLMRKLLPRLSPNSVMSIDVV